MKPFKISTKRLPVKWQMELREALGPAAAPASAPAVENDSSKAAPEILVNAESLQTIDELWKWIQRMNRQQKSGKAGAQTLPTQGISLTLERADGARITLTERNASVVKQFLGND